MASPVALTLALTSVLAALGFVGGARVKRWRASDDGGPSQKSKRLRVDRLELPVVDEPPLPCDCGLNVIRMTQHEQQVWETRQELALRCGLIRSTVVAAWVTRDDQFTFTARQSQALLRHFNKDLLDIPDDSMDILHARLAGPDVLWHRAFASLNVVLHDARRPGTLINALDMNPNTQPVRLVMQLFYEHAHDVVTGNTSLAIAVAGLQDKRRAMRAVHVLARLHAPCKTTPKHGSMLIEAILSGNYNLVPLLLGVPFRLDPLVERGPGGMLPYDLLTLTADPDEPDVIRAILTFHRVLSPDDEESSDDDEDNYLIDEREGTYDGDHSDDPGADAVAPGHCWTIPRSLRRLQKLMDVITVTSILPPGPDACAICLEKFAVALPGQRHLAVLGFCSHVFHWGCIRPWFIRQSRHATRFTCPMCRADPSDDSDV